MWLFTHDIVLSDPACLELDSLGFHIKKLDGEIYVANKTDTIVVLSSDLLGRDFVVANGSDTLVLSLKDSLPIESPANHSLTLRYESKENSSFFQNLPCKNTWMSLYKLLGDSTFSLLKISVEAKKIRLLHGDLPFSYLRDDSGETLKEFWNEGIFDKEERGQRFWRISE